VAAAEAKRLADEEAKKAAAEVGNPEAAAAEAKAAQAKAAQEKADAAAAAAAKDAEDKSKAAAAAAAKVAEAKVEQEKAEAAATAAAAKAANAAAATAAAATAAEKAAATAAAEAAAKAAEAAAKAAAPAPTTYMVTIRIPKKDFVAFLAEPSRPPSKEPVSRPTLTWTNPPNTNSVTLGNQYGTFVIKIGDCITAKRSSTTLGGTIHNITAKITHFVDEEDPATTPQLYYKRYTKNGTLSGSNPFLERNTYNTIQLLDKCPDVATSSLP